MFSACFSCHNASTSSEINPGLLAGKGRLNDLRAAVDHVAATTQACIKLASSLEHDLHKVPAGQAFAKSVQESRQSLKGFAKLCEYSQHELKCFTRYFSKDYPKGGNTADLINPKEEYLDNEVRRRGGFAHELATQGRPVANKVELVMKSAGRFMSQNPSTGLVRALEDLERTSALHR